MNSQPRQRPSSRSGLLPPRFIQHAPVWHRAAILIALCIALAAIASSQARHEAFIEVLTVMQEVIAEHPLAGISLFVAFAAVSAMFAFVSVAVIVPAAVFAWGEAASMALLWVGWILGGVATYTVGKFLGRPAVRWLTASRGLHRFEGLVRQGAPFWLVLLMQLALPSEIPGYVLGLARYSFRSYLLALGLAELPYTVATVYLGASFVERRGLVIIGVGIAIALFGVAAFYVLRRVGPHLGKAEKATGLFPARTDLSPSPKARGPS